MSDLEARELLFGDALALARGQWLQASAARLKARGYQDFRRSDAWLSRALLGGEVPLATLGSSLRVTRQAVRKLVDGLVARGYAEVLVDAQDFRRRNVVLTAAGDAYARDVIAVIHELNDELTRRVEQDDLAAAFRVLRSLRERFGS